MLAVTPSAHAVVRIGLDHFVALERAGNLPMLPNDVIRLNSKGRFRNVDLCELAELEFYVTGDQVTPSGLLALWPRFDFLYGSDALEIVHLSGSRFALPRLLREASAQARARSIVLTGNTSVRNRGIARLIKRCLPNAEPDCVKWSEAP